MKTMNTKKLAALLLALVMIVSVLAGCGSSGTAESAADANEIVILEIQPVDEENENYVAVESEDTLDAVYAIFKERYKDVLEFED